MSTLNVESISHPTSGSLVTINGTAPSNRNLIINGAMQVAQRGTQVTGSTGDGYKTVDRFRISHTSLGTFTYDQDTDAPAGFSDSFKASCTTADSSPAAGDLLIFMQRVEAQNLQMLDYGASGAKDLTLSFYVKSNKTGSASVSILQNDNSNKLVSFQYSISTADTWEKKTVTIPGDTAGVIDNDNGYGFQVEWFLNSGSNFTGGSHRSTWTTYNANDRNVSNLGIGGSTSDYWQITGVQLEVGSVATPFEHRSYGDELARCERYFQVIKAIQAMSGGASTIVTSSINLRTVMRSTPTWEQTGAFTFERSFYGGTTQTSASVTVYSAGSNTPYGSYLRFNNIPPTLPDNVGYYLNDSTDYLTASAEL
jgi:hypothetical protein